MLPGIDVSHTLQARGVRLFVIVEDVGRRNPEPRAYLTCDLGRQ